MHHARHQHSHQHPHAHADHSHCHPRHEHAPSFHGRHAHPIHASRHGEGRHDDHGHGFRGPGNPHGGGRRGGGNRALGHGDLKLLLLALIEQQPRHGYELIRTIADMFGGRYTPSPGSIYPTLTLLEELGLISSQPGPRKCYAIAETGRLFLSQNRELVDAVMARTEHSARMAARMALPAPVRAAMEQLKQALLAPQAGWTEAETARVTALLEQAATAIAQRSGA